MNSNRVVWLMMFLGGFIGGFIPMLWGSSGFSFSVIFGNAIGALIGIWIGFKLTH